MPSVRTPMKIHVILKKEDIEIAEIDSQKIAVVFDVLFATTTITACLEAGAKTIIPVCTPEEARAIFHRKASSDYCMAGELNGEFISSFLTPLPRALCEQVKSQNVILSTTNGTVALSTVAPSKFVYAASLLNARAVAKQVMNVYDGETILVVCAGSANQFNIEDFYGAGLFVSLLKELSPSTILSDSAQAACLFYEQSSNALEILSLSKVGRQIIAKGYNDEVVFASQQHTSNVVPQLIDGESIVPSIQGT